MEIYGVPTCYTDDHNLWHDFFSYIEILFPIAELNLNLNEINLQTAKNVPISFFPHNDVVWENKDHPINTYKKPFLFLYLVSFDDYDEYKKTNYEKLFEFINANYKINEWIIIYYPNFVINSEISYVNIYFKKKFMLLEIHEKKL